MNEIQKLEPEHIEISIEDAIQDIVNRSPVLVIEKLRDFIYELRNQLKIAIGQLPDSPSREQMKEALEETDMQNIGIEEIFHD